MMPMFKLPTPTGSFWKTLAAALMAAGMVHILATLAPQNVTSRTAYQRLAPHLPVNKMLLLAPVTPTTQVLPFQSPDQRYAMCRFDASDGPVTLRAVLPEPGWTLALYSPAGEAFYSMIAQPQRQTDVALVLMPPGDRFTPAVGDSRLTGVLQVALPVRSGLAVVQGPNDGRVFTGSVERVLSLASCRGSSS